MSRGPQEAVRTDPCLHGSGSGVAELCPLPAILHRCCESFKGVGQTVLPHQRLVILGSLLVLCYGIPVCQHVGPARPARYRSLRGQRCCASDRPKGGKAASSLVQDPHLSNQFFYSKKFQTYRKKKWNTTTMTTSTPFT